MKKGFTLIEIIIAIALSAVILPALVFSLTFSLQSTKQGEKYTKAQALVQEQMEAVFYLKSNDPAWDWESNPENTLETEYYQAKMISGSWSLGTKTTAPVQENGFIKTIKIEPAKRDVMGYVSEDITAESDDRSRWIKVKVTWNEKGQEEAVEAKSLITDH